MATIERGSHQIESQLSMTHVAPYVKHPSIIGLIVLGTTVIALVHLNYLSQEMEDYREHLSKRFASSLHLSWQACVESRDEPAFSIFTAAAFLTGGFLVFRGGINWVNQARVSIDKTTQLASFGAILFVVEKLFFSWILSHRPWNSAFTVGAATFGLLLYSSRVSLNARDPFLGYGLIATATPFLMGARLSAIDACFQASLGRGQEEFELTQEHRSSIFRVVETTIFQSIGIFCYWIAIVKARELECNRLRRLSPPIS